MKLGKHAIVAAAMSASAVVGGASLAGAELIEPVRDPIGFVFSFLDTGSGGGCSALGAGTCDGTGTVGPQGIQGTQGIQGIQGIQGLPGPSTGAVLGRLSGSETVTQQQWDSACSSYYPGATKFVVTGQDPVIVDFVDGICTT